ncbi:MAG: type II toxin-antitoxin system Phd/YefM family antitoxin [Gemmatimonadota bacterium]
MKTVTMHKAKTTLSQLVAEVEAGEEIIIMRGKVPAARLVGLHAGATRTFGALAGQVAVTAAFFEPLPESELESWDG